MQNTASTSATFQYRPCFGPVNVRAWADVHATILNNNKAVQQKQMKAQTQPQGVRGLNNFQTTGESDAFLQQHLQNEWKSRIYSRSS